MADFNMARDLQINSMFIEIDGVRSILVIALCNGHLIGTMEVFCRSSGTAEVQNLFVRPDHRRKGIGRKLLGLAAELGRERGCKGLALAVSRSNESAVEFYRRLGFTICEQEISKICNRQSAISNSL